MIPSKNENNCNQKIKIQLTSDNKCIIKSTIESGENSKATINKSEYSINIPDLKDINDNELLTLSKSLTNNQNNDNEANSNLLISFSNISELNKTGDLSLWIAGEQNKNQILENKENIDLNNDIVNINLNDKSKCSDISNKSNKSKNNKSNIINCKKKINKKYIKNKNENQFIGNKKIFKNIKTQNTDKLNIIHKIEKKEKKESKDNNILTIPCTNFSFGGNNSSNNNTNTNNYNSNNNNDNKNEDYASPTFNVKINFNSLENNNNNNIKNENIIKNESRNKNINNMNNNTKIKKESKTTNNSFNNKIKNNKNINDKYKKIELCIKITKKNNAKKKNLSSSNLLPKEKFHNKTSLDRIKFNHNKNPHKQNLDKHPHLSTNRTFSQNILSHLYNKNKSLTNIKMSSNKSTKKLTSTSSPKNLKEKKNNITIKSNSNSSSASRNLINTSKILLKKNKSSINIKSKEKTNKTSSNKIKIPTKAKGINKINKFNLISKRINTKNKSPPKILDKSSQNSKKEKIQERIAKTSLNTYRNTKNTDNNLIKNKKNSSLVYSRKRNLNERYNKIFNNSSNNSSKDSTRIYHSIINRSLQSIDKNKKINNTILNNKKKILYNDCNKNKNKKFIAIQNFSRYKKKSVLFYKNKNNETNINTNNNNYFITDKKF